MRDPIEEFLKSGPFAVLGASTDPAKFGHRVFAAYLRHGLRAFPVNPTADEILGQKCYPDLAALPEPVGAVSIITPPPVTEKLIPEVIAAGVKHVWMQPGAESAAAIRAAEAAGLSVIAGGPCILVELARRG